MNSFRQNTGLGFICFSSSKYTFPSVLRSSWMKLFISLWDLVTDNATKNKMNDLNSNMSIGTSQYLNSKTASVLQQVNNTTGATSWQQDIHDYHWSCNLQPIILYATRTMGGKLQLVRTKMRVHIPPAYPSSLNSLEIQNGFQIQTIFKMKWLLLSRLWYI